MSSGEFLLAMERKKLASSIVVLVVCVAAVLWHGPSFALCVATAVAAIYVVVKLIFLRRLRREGAFQKNS